MTRDGFYEFKFCYDCDTAFSEENTPDGRCPYCHHALPRPSFCDTWVYFVQCTVTKRVKIGLSKDPHARLRDMQVGCATKLRLLAVTEGDYEYEQSLHARFRRYRLHGEWFHGAPELMTCIRALTNAR